MPRDHNRSILHLNVADFAVAVETALDRRLAGRPVLVAAPGAARATVYDMSDTAYRAGVRKGMRLSHAQSLDRDLRVLPLRLDRYERAMHALTDLARPYSPQIEQAAGDGHLFVDLTGTGRLWGPPPDVAWRLRNSARRELGLDPIWAVAANKLVAKVATRLVKPAGEYIVEPGEETAFLQAVPVQLLPGLHPAVRERLRELHLWKAGDVARLSLGQLTVAVGATAARGLYDKVRGIDTAPVPNADDLAAGELQYEHEFADDTTDRETVENALYRLVDQAGGALRRRGRGARRWALQLAYADGVLCRRQRTCPQPEDHTPRIEALAQALLLQAWQRRIRIRHLRLSCTRLSAPPVQLQLFPDAAREAAREAQLMVAIDRIRDRFGHDAIHPAHGWTATFTQAPAAPPMPLAPAGDTPFEGLHR